MVEAVGHAVGQTLHKRVLRGQRGEHPLRVRVARDKARHLRRELVGKTHDRQKLPLLRGERIHHRGGEGRVDVGLPVRQHAALGERPQVQIDRGKPALAGIEQVRDLLVGELRAAAVGIDGQLRVVEPELLRPDLIDPRAEPHRLGGGEKAVTAGDDQVHVPRQAVCERAEKRRRPPVGQQVEVVYKQETGHVPRQLVAEVIREQSAARRVRRAGIVPQKRKPRAGEGVLHAPPEDGEVVGVHADADDAQRLRPRAPLEIPVHRRGLPVAHRGHHGRQGAAGDRPQALLQPLRCVDGVQIPFGLRHGTHLRGSFFSLYHARRRGKRPGKPLFSPLKNAGRRAIRDM